MSGALSPISDDNPKSEEIEEITPPPAVVADDKEQEKEQEKAKKIEKAVNISAQLDKEIKEAAKIEADRKKLENKLYENDEEFEEETDDHTESSGGHFGLLYVLGGLAVLGTAYKLIIGKKRGIVSNDEGGNIPESVAVSSSLGVNT